MTMQIFGIRFYLAEIISSFGTVCLIPVAEMIQDDRDLLGPLWLSSPPVFERPQWASKQPRRASAVPLEQLDACSTERWRVWPLPEMHKRGKWAAFASRPLI